jgi:pimeloyl-ACP methyl ester carboxylesterase
MHHHYGGQRAAMLAWIELFTRLGVDCLAFDARGHGASPCRATEETYRQRFADVRAARNELHRRGYETIIGFGQSQGGAVLIGALAHDPALAGMILDSGPSATALPSLVGLARLMQREAGGPAARPEIAPGTMAVAPPASERLTTALLAGLLFRRTGPATYPLFLWRGLWQLRRRPLLWLHGTADSVIERHRAARWYAPLRRVAPAWRELRVEGAEHVQCLQHSPAAVERAVTAFVQRMAG